ncbi:MAG: hypothetical protein HUJ51_06210 [Eggerthellaceae bacterium]|nr:hypothetical protein [Eggerthellaceae bacterium]
MPEPHISATLRLDSNLDSIKGLSTATAIKMRNARMYKIRDLLNYLPSEYTDFTEIIKLGSARLNRNCSFVAKVHEMREKIVKGNMNLVEMSLSDGNELMICAFFKQPWVMNRYEQGDRLLVCGKLFFNFGFKRMTNPIVQKLEEGSEVLPCGPIVPRYESLEYISAAKIRTYVSAALKMIKGVLDPLPLELRRKYKLFSRQNFYRNIHKPFSMDALDQARRRLKYHRALNREILFSLGSIEKCLDDTCENTKFVKAVRADAQYILSEKNEACRLYLKELQFLRQAAKYNVK